MAKWKQLPTDRDELEALYTSLKDKEMKLEADLAIKEHPPVEEAVTLVALSLADVKKLDSKIMKETVSESSESKARLNALLNRATYLRQQLEITESQIKQHGGKTAERIASLKYDRDRSFNQLMSSYRHAKKIFDDLDLDLAKILPSVTDFIAVS